MAKDIRLNNRNFSIICNDPGGSDIILRYLNEKNLTPKSLFLTKTSKKIFKKKYCKLQTKDKKYFLKSSSIFVTGTSWKSELEKRFIAKNKNKNIKIISFLDSWFNYKKRFEINGSFFFPHEIWTFDKYAYSLAKDKIPNVKIKRKFLNNKMKKNKKNLNNNLLYITEPISELAYKMYKNKNYFQFNEKKTLDIFLRKSREIFGKFNNIFIRIHPNEKKGKYFKIIKKYKNLPIKLSNKSLSFDLSNCNKVIGAASNVLFSAINNGNQVFTTVSKKNIKLRLPFKKIKHLGLV
tara:strand:+ start:3223 stop:4101 length:879 start_codon:yes stop_codon:yes gene_type:complete